VTTGGPPDEGSRPLPRATLRTLAARTATALADPAPDPAGQAWARSLLTPPEYGLWSRLSPFDQDHAIRVAREVERRLSATPFSGDPLWPAFALMHDVGKLCANLSALERAAAMVASRFVRVGVARRWAASGEGFRQRIGAYLVHGELGAALIRDAGGREPVAAWTEVHQGYRPGMGRALPPAVARALLDADVR
jgi:hypothetical protein